MLIVEGFVLFSSSNNLYLRMLEIYNQDLC